MLNKKWAGVVAASSVVGGAVQSYVGCADIYDILSNLKSDKNLNAEKIDHLAESTKYFLIVTRDFAVAEAMAKRMYEILEKRERGEGIRIINALKEFAKINDHYANDIGSIETLLNRIKYPNNKLPEERQGLELIKYLLKSSAIKITNNQRQVIRFSSFLEEKDLLNRLLECNESDFLWDYKSYSEEMFDNESALTKCINHFKSKFDLDLKKSTGLGKGVKIFLMKKELNREIAKIIVDALNCVKEYYSKTSGWIRYLATLGIFVNENQFPTQKNDYKIILIKHYCSKIPGSALHGLLSSANYFIMGPCFAVPTNVLATPFANKAKDNLESSIRYELLNYDVHLKSLSASSRFDSSSIFDFDKTFIPTWIKETVFNIAREKAGKYGFLVTALSCLV